jgi:hypothetical protein
MDMKNQSLPNLVSRSSITGRCAVAVTNLAFDLLLGSTAAILLIPLLILWAW